MKNNDLCPICGEGSVILRSETRTTKPAWYDFEVRVKSEWAECDVCMSDFADAEIMKRNATYMREAIAAYLKEHNIDE